MSAKAKWIVLLVVFGLGVSAYLATKAHDPSSVACSIGGACETVLSSQYAWFLGVSVAVWGLIWYGATLLLTYLVFSAKKVGWYYFFLWILGGLAFSLYLFGLETFKIHAYCTWCLSSLGAVVLIFVLTLFSRKELITS